MKKEKIQIPENLDQAINILEEMSKNEADEIKNKSEREFGSSVHHGFGTNIRNSWGLWWQEKWKDEYKEGKPKIVQFFNDLDIYHADDMSGIIMDSFHRKITGKEIDLKGQVEKYKNFWKKEGFKDGIFKDK